jgi:Polyketide cyclase / dehydrase and lipid transport
MPAKLFYTGPSLGTLHEEYAKKSRIDEQAPLTSVASITIDAPGPAVWAVISDVAGWPAWYSEFTVLELGEVRPGADALEARRAHHAVHLRRGQPRS